MGGGPLTACAAIEKPPSAHHSVVGMGGFIQEVAGKRAGMVSVRLPLAAAGCCWLPLVFRLHVAGLPLVASGWQLVPFLRPCLC